MSPERKKMIGNRKVEEFYWAGKMVTYVDNRLSQHPFDEAVSIVEMDEARAEEQRAEEEAEERRRLENEEMARHFEKHPHG